MGLEGGPFESAAGTVQEPEPQEPGLQETLEHGDA